jgi:hypothetical protein
VRARGARSQAHLRSDVTVDADFAPYREIAASVPFRAVLSCPLITTRAGSSASCPRTRLTGSCRRRWSSLGATYCTRLADAIVQRVRANDLPAVAEALALDLRQTTRDGHAASSRRRDGLD